MNLIIDIGNTTTKLAVYSGREKVSASMISDLSCEDLEKWLSAYKIDKAIVSSVKKLPPFIRDLIFANLSPSSAFMLSHESNLPFRLEYETPETLGTDRIASVAGAFSLFPDSEILIIDAGTAITFDFLSAGTYKGGNISPGLSIRLKALNKFTSKLPLISLSDNFTSPGRNTTDAIAAGVVTGVKYEINEYIRTFEKKGADLKIILTGGDSKYLKEKINHQFIYMPDIVIDGLNYILEYNAT